MNKYLLMLLAGLALGATAGSPTVHVTLAWDVLPDATVAGYRLYYGPASRNYTNSVSLGNVTSGTVSNLDTSGTFFFAVTAYNAVGVESLFSDEVIFKPSDMQVKGVRMRP